MENHHRILHIPISRFQISTSANNFDFFWNKFATKKNPFVQKQQNMNIISNKF